MIYIQGCFNPKINFSAIYNFLNLYTILKFMSRDTGNNLLLSLNNLNKFRKLNLFFRNLFLVYYDS